MGKYARKAKMALEVAAVMDVSQSYLGVRTRAKTLALQSTAPPPSNRDDCYLELRSRRLERPIQRQNSRQSCGWRGKPEIGSRERCVQSASIEEEKGLGTEASFGENDLDSEARERTVYSIHQFCIFCRGTRESAPCNTIRAAYTMTTPGSTTKETCSSSASKTASNTLLPNVPSARELEEFFACEEQPLQRHFVEKYNFDIVSDLPLPGRYEWVAVRP